MVNKSLCLGKLIIVLLFAMILASCHSPAGGETDTWSNVTNLEQLDGTWESTYSQKNISIKEALDQVAMVQGLIELPQETQIMLGLLPKDLEVDSVTDITLTIDAAQKTQAMSVTSEETFKSENINSFWVMLKLYLGNFKDERVTVTTNDKTHTVTMTYDNPTTPLSDEEIASMLDSGLQINRSGTKIKVPADYLMEGSPELIFDKQQ